MTRGTKDLYREHVGQGNSLVNSCRSDAPAHVVAACEVMILWGL
jgi:hypothetical protein